jgi:hypothetical protein
MEVGCTNTKLHRLLRVLVARYETELRKAGLRMTQFWLLSTLLDAGWVARGQGLTRTCRLTPRAHKAG